MTLAEPQVRRWTRQEYYCLAEQGWFAGQRVQLIDGEIIQMPVRGHAHVKAVSRISKLMESIFGPGHWVRVQAPLNAGQYGDPEPDIAVVAGDMEDYGDHPTTAMLVIEVSDTTLRLDRRKAGLYARAGVADYWIVDLPERRLEVYRDPRPAAAGEFGFNYAPPRVLASADTISPLAKPDAPIRLADLLT
jgi:Uma2 family endonuclease